MQGNNVPLSYLARQHSVLLQGLALIITTVVMVFGVVTPLFVRANDMQKQLNLKRETAKELEDQVVFLTNLDASVLKTRIQLLDAALPPSKDVLLYLSTIDGLSRELSLSLRGIQLSPGEVSTGSGSKDNAAASAKPATGAEGMHSLDTQLTISGREESIYAFLRAIEQTAPLMRVKDVKVNRLGEDNFSLGVMLSMLYADPVTASGLKGKTVLFSEMEESVLQQVAQLKLYSSSQEVYDTIPVGKQNLFEGVKIEGN